MPTYVFSTSHSIFGTFGTDILLSLWIQPLDAESDCITQFVPCWQAIKHGCFPSGDSYNTTPAEIGGQFPLFKDTIPIETDVEEINIRRHLCHTLCRYFICWYVYYQRIPKSLSCNPLRTCVSSCLIIQSHLVYKWKLPDTIYFRTRFVNLIPFGFLIPGSISLYIGCKLHIRPHNNVIPNRKAYYDLTIFWK